MGNNDIMKSKVPYTAKDHFILNFYAAVFMVLNFMHNIGELDKKKNSFDKFPFLEKYFSEIMKIVPEDMNWDDGKIF